MSTFQHTIQIYFHNNPNCSSRNGVVGVNGLCHVLRICSMWAVSYWTSDCYLSISKFALREFSSGWNSCIVCTLHAHRRCHRAELRVPTCSICTSQVRRFGFPGTRGGFGNLVQQTSKFNQIANNPCRQTFVSPDVLRVLILHISSPNSTAVSLHQKNSVISAYLTANPPSPMTRSLCVAQCHCQAEGKTGRWKLVNKILRVSVPCVVPNPSPSLPLPPYTITTAKVWNRLVIQPLSLNRLRVDEKDTTKIKTLDLLTCCRYRSEAQMVAKRVCQALRSRDAS
jgi:hypothetical protein